MQFNNSKYISSISRHSNNRIDYMIELPYWVAAALVLLCIAGFWYALKAQDKYIEKLKRDRGDDTSLHV